MNKSEAEDILRSNADPREYGRINCEFPVLIQSTLHRQGKQSVEGEAVNISEGGLGFICKSDLCQPASGNFAVDDPVKLYFKLPSQNSYSMELNGKIVYRIHADSSVKIGIKFRNLTQLEKETIRQFVG